MHRPIATGRLGDLARRVVSGLSANAHGAQEFAGDDAHTVNWQIKHWRGFQGKNASNTA
jgi:hypothetical protein